MNLDEFAAQLVEHQESMNERLRDAAQLHEANFKTVEEHYAKQDARLQELQQSIFAAAAASSSAPPGAGDPTGLAAARERLDQVPRAALESSEKHKETEHKFVTLHFALQSMQADGVSKSRSQFVQGMDFLRAEFDKRLADLEPRIAAGTCRCPASCPGTQAGPGDRAQHANYSAASAGNAATNHSADSAGARATGTPAELPKADRGQDPWSQARAESRGGSCGPGGGHGS